MPENLEDQKIREWYAPYAKKFGLVSDPFDPSHFYDYRAAYRAGAKPDETGHWPSQFKLEGHPRMVVGGVNTKTGESENPYLKLAEEGKPTSSDFPWMAEVMPFKPPETKPDSGLKTSPSWVSEYPHLAAIPPTVGGTLATTTPFGKYLTEEGREELEGPFFPIGSTTDPEKLKIIEKELMTGQKRVSPYESLAGETLSALDWLAFPTAQRYAGAVAKEVLPKKVVEFMTKPRELPTLPWKMLESERGSTAPPPPPRGMLAAVEVDGEIFSGTGGHASLVKNPDLMNKIENAKRVRNGFVDPDGNFYETIKEAKEASRKMLRETGEENPYLGILKSEEGKIVVGKPSAEEYPKDFPYKVKKSGEIVGSPGLKSHEEYLDWQKYMFDKTKEGRDAEYWYRNSATAIAGHTGSVPMAEKYIAGTSVTSPMATVEQNLGWAEQIYKAKLQGKPAPTGGRFETNIPRVEEAWEKGSAKGMGQKIEPFGEAMREELYPHLRRELPGEAPPDVHVTVGARYKRQSKEKGEVPLKAPSPEQAKFIKSEFRIIAKNLSDEFGYEIKPKEAEAMFWSAWKARMDRAEWEMGQRAKEQKLPLLQEMVGRGKHEAYDIPNVVELARSYSREDMAKWFRDEMGGLYPDFSHYMVKKGLEKDYQEMMKKGREVIIQNVPKTDYSKFPLEDRDTLRTVIHFGRAMEDRPPETITVDTLARLNGAKTPAELQTYSKEVARRMNAAGTLGIEFHPVVHSYDPLNLTREMKVTQGKTPYNITVREAEIYDGWNDPLGLWKKAREATQDRDGIRAVFEDQVHKAGYRGYTGKAGEGSTEYNVFLFGESLGAPPKEFQVGISQKVTGVGKTPKDLSEAREMGLSQFDQFKNDIKEAKAKWPELETKERTYLGNYFKWGDEYEPSMSFSVIGPPESVKAFTSYLALTKNQHSVILTPKSSAESNGVLVKFKLKGKPKEIDKAAKNIDFNIKEYPDGMYVEHFVPGGDAVEVNKLADLFGKIGEEGTFLGDYAYFDFIEKADQKMNLINFYGKRGEAFYDEAVKKGIDWTNSLRPHGVSEKAVR